MRSRRTLRSPHEKHESVLSRAPQRGAAIDARPQRRRARARSDGARSRAQSRFDVSLSAGQLFLLSVRIPGARGGGRAGGRSRRRQARAVLPRKERGTRNLGRLSLRARRRARDFRLRRGVSDRGAAVPAPRSRIRPAGALHAARLVRAVGPAGHAAAERRAQPRAHRRFRAGRSRRRARHHRRDAARRRMRTSRI